MNEGKWVYFEFQEMSKSGKTERYTVRSKQGNLYIGEVRWNAPWRKYAFFPYNDTLYEQDCLRDIAKLLDELMQERKQNSLQDYLQVVIGEDSLGRWK